MQIISINLFCSLFLLQGIAFFDLKEDGSDFFFEKKKKYKKIRFCIKLIKNRDALPNDTVYYKMKFKTRNL